MPSSRPSSLRGRNTPDSAASEAGLKPRANRNLILDNSAASSATSISKSPEAASSAHNHSNGLLTTLHHLLPRHALFHVCVQIHQIDSIPLTQGEFAVRWKLKNASKSRRKPARTATASKHSLLGLVSKGKKENSEYLEELNNRVADRLNERRPVVPSVVVSRNSEDSPAESPFSADASSSSATSSSSIVTPPSTPPKGITPFLPLKDHSVEWSQTLHTTVKMSISRGSTTENGGVLLSSPMKLVVLQRIIPGDPGAPRNPRLGAVYLNLAEYAGVEGETTRRYLLRQSKTNATLKLTISLTHLGGDTDYTAPPLPKGEILNGISGILERDVYNTRPKALDLYGPYYSYSQNRRELAVTALTGLRANSSSSRSQSHGLSDTDGTSDEEDAHDDDHFFNSHEDLRRTLHSNSHSRTHSLDGHVPCSQTDLAKPARPHKNKPQPLVVRSSPLSPITASPLSARSHSSISPLSAGAIPFDITHLPFAYGPKTTENLIEAIFNPVPVIEKPGVLGSRTKIGRVPVEENPFVYFIPDDADMTIGRSLSPQGGVKSPPLAGPLLGPKSAGQSPNSGVSDLADVSSVYSTTSPSSASVATSNSTGSGSIHGSSKGSSKGKGSIGGSSHQSDPPSTTSSSAESHRSETPSSPTKAGWLRRHHKEIIAQSNPHSGTRPDLYGHVDSVVGIVL